MTQPERLCFIIMPFEEELNYFFLYLKKHIEEKFPVDCRRGDSDILDIPLLDKIKGYIHKAEVIIADCSGRNPNVFYELGMAHTMEKRVILITRDPVEEAPTDIRHYEFIRYNLSGHEEFLAALDKALRPILVKQYDLIYERACDVFNEFKTQTTAKPQMARKDVFIERVIAGEKREGLPSLNDDAAIREFVLPRIVGNKDEKDVIEAIAEWYKGELFHPIEKEDS